MITILAALGAVAAQFGAMFWWASGVSHSVGDIQVTIAPLRDGHMVEQIGRMDERTTRTAKDVDEMKIWMRGISDRLESRSGHAAD